MLRARTEIAKEVVSTHFADLTELEKRHLESTLLQILAAIYAPPRSATPIDVDKLLLCVKEGKQKIDEMQANLFCKVVEQRTVLPHAVNTGSTGSTVKPLHLTRNEFNEIVVTVPMLRPTPRRVGLVVESTETNSEI